MLSLDLLVLVLLSRADDPVYVYNATNIQLLRMAIVPSFQGDTLLAMSCDDLRSIEFCGVDLSFFCSGYLSNANMSTTMDIFITDENAVTELPSKPSWNITTACRENLVQLGGVVVLSGVVNHVTEYEKDYQWVDYCGTFDITMFYVQTAVENQVYPTELIYLNYTPPVHNNDTIFECPGGGRLGEGTLLLIIGGAAMGLVVLSILIFFLSRAYGHPVLKLCPSSVLNRTKNRKNTAEEEDTYADISNREEPPPPTVDREVDGLQCTRSKTILSVDSGVFSLRPSPIVPRDSFSFSSRRMSLDTPSQVENHLYLQSHSLPLRRPSRLSVGSVILEEAQEQKRRHDKGRIEEGPGQSIHDIPDDLVTLAERMERTRRYLPRKLSNQSERLGSLGSIQEM